MENKLTRREFLTQKATGTGSPIKKPKDDPFFKQYANKELPFSNARTASGLNQYTGSWSEADILHLLRRVTFGASKKSADILKGMNLSDAVDFLIDNPLQPSTYTYPINVYQDLYADTQGCPFGQSWVYFSAPDNNDGMLDLHRTNYSFKPWWVGLMITQETHILEKITLFWANHFGTQTADFNTPKAIWQHYDTIRKNGLGNFRTLIKAITIDPHMLLYLNGNSNSASAPDENYARELQELFTIGKGLPSAYSEDDVKAAAKTLTGWRRKSQPDGAYTAYFNDAEHDTSDKQFSAFYNNRIIAGHTGANGAMETDDLIDMILGVDETAKYICRCLYRWFVYYVIDQSEEDNIITPMAQIFRNSNYEIAPVLKALFKSEHFFDPLNRGCVIKSPVDLIIGFARELNLPLPPDAVADKYNHWLHFRSRLDELDQLIGDPPSVAGWPAYYQQPVFYQAWINSDTIQKRASILSNYTNNYGYPVENSNMPVHIDSIAYAKSFLHPEDPNYIVENFVLYLLPQPQDASEFVNMKNILLSNLSDNTNDYYWTNAWNAYIYNPGADPIAEATVRTRLNALIAYITDKEEYQLC